MKKIALPAGVRAIQGSRWQKLKFSNLNNLAPAIFYWRSLQAQCFLVPE